MCGENPYIYDIILSDIYYNTFFDIMEGLVPKKKRI